MQDWVCGKARKLGFAAVVAKSDSGYGEWSVSVIDGTHNHIMAKRLEGHKYVERLKADEATNKYELPLIEFVGTTSTELTFSIGFAFMTSEKEDNFVWALERCRDLLKCLK
ncbi:FAR1-related protein [Trifolium medium]|uniref:FAR1-related protein n=1 Tax=Trifolium medium TaxID=97028 RepID=A0A392LZ69_9FABA|nr:FAR1-related protein [Trifolium medium]